MIFNLDTFRSLARNPRTALTPWDRLRGMIGRQFTEEFDALVFPRCGAIHMWFMANPIDAVFLDGENRVVGVAPELKPWRCWAGAPGAVTVIELPAGAIAASETEVGHKINLNTDLTPEAIAKMRYDGILCQVPRGEARVKLEKRN